MIVFQQTPVIIEGGQAKSYITDPDQQELLTRILMELKKINIIWEEMSDLNIDNEDIDL